jgi:hypothetical protein
MRSFYVLMGRAIRGDGVHKYRRLDSTTIIQSYKPMVLSNDCSFEKGFRRSLIFQIEESVQKFDHRQLTVRILKAITYIDFVSVVVRKRGDRLATNYRLTTTNPTGGVEEMQ